MNAKTNLILLVIAGALVGILMLDGNPLGKSVGEDVKRGALFPKVESGDPCEIDITHGDKRVTLVKKQAGAEGEATWHVTSMQDHPAATHQVTALLEKLRSFMPDSPAGRKASTHEGFKVNDALGTRAVVKDAAGTVLADVVVGDAGGIPPEIAEQIKRKGMSGIDVSSKPYTYVRESGKDTVWTIWDNVASAFTADPDRWIDRRVVHMELKDVVKLEVTRGDDSLRFERTGDAGTPDSPYDDTWQLLGEPALPALRNVVNAMANRICSASVSSLVSDADKVATGLDQPRVTATATTATGESATILIGAARAPAADKPDETPTDYYMQVQGQQFVYLVAASSVLDLEKPRQDCVDLDLTTYAVNSAERVEITDGVGADATTYVLEKESADYNAPWKVTSPEGYETDNDAVKVLLAALSPGSDKKAASYVTDGSSWEPGSDSRTIKAVPPAREEGKEAPAETLTLGGPDNDGKIRARVGGRTPDLWIERSKFESLLQDVSSWVWKAGAKPTEEEVPLEGGALEGGELGPPVPVPSEVIEEEKAVEEPKEEAPVEEAPK